MRLSWLLCRDIQRTVRLKKFEKEIRIRMDKKKLTIYLIATFGIAWVLQVAGSIFALKGNSFMFTVMLSISMYAPFFGTLFAKIPLRGMGFKPKWKGNLKYIALA